MISRFLHNVHEFVRKRELLYIHALFTLMLFIGLVNYTGTKYVHYIIFYLLALVLTYVLLNKFIKNTTLLLIDRLSLYTHTADKLQIYLIVSGLIFMVIHLTALGQLPFIECWSKQNIIETALLRQAITDNTQSWLNYGASFLIKGFLPIILLLLMVQKKWNWFIPVVIISIFYEINLLQKNYFLILLMPVLLYSLFLRKWIFSAAFSLTMILGIYTLIYATNPELRGIKPQSDTKTEIRKKPEGEFSSFQAGSSGILNRVFIVPGKVVGLWFNNIPSKYPYLKGNGYSFIAKIKHIPLVEYSNVLYAELYPQYAAEGLSGSVNTANFMYDYANFGLIGILLSGVIMAVWLYFLQQLFHDAKYLFILNFFPVAMLTSTSLLTLLFSGGWFIIVFLFLIFRNKFLHNTPYTIN